LNNLKIEVFRKLLFVVMDSIGNPFG